VHLESNEKPFKLELVEVSGKINPLAFLPITKKHSALLPVFQAHQDLLHDRHRL